VRNHHRSTGRSGTTATPMPYTRGLRDRSSRSGGTRMLIRPTTRTPALIAACHLTFAISSIRDSDRCLLTSVASFPTCSARWRWKAVGEFAACRSGSKDGAVPPVPCVRSQRASWTALWCLNPEYGAAPSTRLTCPLRDRQGNMRVPVATPACRARGRRPALGPAAASAGSSHVVVIERHTIYRLLRLSWSAEVHRSGTVAWLQMAGESEVT
jgi:hypothetical protein